MLLELVILVAMQNPSSGGGIAISQIHSARYADVDKCHAAGKGINYGVAKDEKYSVQISYVCHPVPNDK